jgi:hypothetical protein
MAMHGSLSPLSSVAPSSRDRGLALPSLPQSRPRLHLVAPPPEKFAGEVPLQPQHGRRLITREQGCALEIVSHAVDYLNDSYLYDGPDDEILDFEAPAFEAARILAAAQQRMLASLPLVESFGSRMRRSVVRILGRWTRSRIDVTPV